MDPAFVFWQVDLRPVRQVQHRFAEECPRREVGAGINREPLWREIRHQALRRRCSCVDVDGAIPNQHDRYVAAQRPRGRRNDLFEYGLRVGRRLADDAQDLRRRSLLASRLSQFGLALRERRS